jgi:polyribonucleotide nucleotidyltransferase
LVVAGTEDSIVMVEGEGKEVSEADLLVAIKLAHENIKSLCKIQIELRNECGKPKREVKLAEKNEELFNEVKALCYDKLKELDRTIITKDERHNKNKALYESVQEALKEKYPEMEAKISEIYGDFQYEDMRTMILDEAKRLDGRGTKDIRPITCEVGVLPRNHGSSFLRAVRHRA